MKVKIKSTGYKNEGFPRILKYLSEINPKQVIFKLDEIDLDGFDLVFDTMKISNLKFEGHDDEHYYISTFTCSKTVFKNMLKLIRSLKKLGDGGHSFEVKINGKSFSWDGDGNDRVVNINDIDCGTGVKNFDKNYKNFFKTDSTQDESLIESLQYLIKESIKSVIDNNYIPKTFINAVNKFKNDYQNAVLYTNDEFPLLDTSTGAESFYQIKNMNIDNGQWTYTIVYNDFNNTTFNEKINLILFDDDDKTFYFNKEDAKSYLSDLKRDLKKGLKYFKEYNPSYDDNEEQRNNFLNNI